MSFRNSTARPYAQHDLECVDGIWVMNITTKNRSKDQTLKTSVSRRKLAVHQARLEAGLIEYRDAVVRQFGNGPLFPNVPVDQYGTRVGRITPLLSDWLRTADARMRAFHIPDRLRIDVLPGRRVLGQHCGVCARGITGAARVFEASIGDLDVVDVPQSHCR